MVDVFRTRADAPHSRTRADMEDSSQKQIEQTMRVDLRPGNTSPSYKGPITGLGNRDNYEDSSLPIPIYRGPPFITFHGWSIL